MSLLHPGCDAAAAGATLSRATPADWLADFNAAEGDRIDLSWIDGNPYNHDVTFIGNDVAFTGIAGQVRYDTAGYVEGDANGDAVADFFIAIDPR